MGVIAAVSMLFACLAAGTTGYFLCCDGKKAAATSSYEVPPENRQSEGQGTGTDASHLAQQLDIQRPPLAAPPAVSLPPLPVSSHKERNYTPPVLPSPQNLTSPHPYSASLHFAGGDTEETNPPSEKGDNPSTSARSAGTAVTAISVTGGFSRDPVYFDTAPFSSFNPRSKPGAPTHRSTYTPSIGAFSVAGSTSGNSHHPSRQGSTAWARSMSLPADTMALAVVDSEPSLTAEDDREKLITALDDLHSTQGLFMNRFRVKDGSAANRGEGTQGVVQAVTDRVTNEDFTIKFYLMREAFRAQFELFSNPLLRAQMPVIDEMEPNATFDIRNAAGWAFPPFVLMQRCEPLDRWQQRVKPSAAAVVKIMKDLAALIRTLHDSGLCHRDIKPGNVVWHPARQEWSLVDFGCAAGLDSSASLMYSLNYAAPEVVRAVEVGQRRMRVNGAIDMWSLGVLMWELLTGEPLFKGQTREEIVPQLMGTAQLPWERRNMRASLKRLHGIRGLVLRCLKRNPDERPMALEVVQAVKREFREDSR